MPIYGYRCSNCGHQLEVMQNFSDKPLTVCPQCQGKLTKIVYPAGVIFKGSGFYKTDYSASGKGSSSNGTSSARESKEGKEGKSETKVESKPESKPESKSDAGD